MTVSWEFLVICNSATTEKAVEHPIILPANDQFSTVFIAEEHRRLVHAGFQDTLTELRVKLTYFKRKAGHTNSNTLLFNLPRAQLCNCLRAYQPTEFEGVSNSKLLEWILQDLWSVNILRN